MLTSKQIKEIRGHLEKAQNPVFFFDNDPDGLCSFLLLQRFLGRGKGVAIRSFPEMTAEYFKKVNEFNADYIFILDKPVVSREFFREAEQVNIPIVWIDHHEINKKYIPEGAYYYNPTRNAKKSNEPVTYLCYKLTEKEKDLWIAVIGCISDRYVPKLYSEFRKSYPDLSIDSKDASKIYYNSAIGEAAKILSFALKDSTTNVINMLRFMLKADSPYEVLEESSSNKSMHERFNEINKKYKKLLEKSLESVDGKLVFFQYGGDLSISADLANELMYRFPKKIISVGYVTGSKVNISLRGKGVRNIALKAIRGLEDATGGGHKMAVGVKIRLEDLEIFREKLEKLSKN
jgi:single-stranded DNA-specific DHH superfamily exonuclease